MKVLCLPLLALAVLFSVETVRSAEPPVTCKLKLVHLKPLPPGKRCPENEVLVRFARGREIAYRKLEGNKEEGDFRATIGREPQYCGEYPFRAVVMLGGKKYGFVLDKRSKQSQVYDRLYFDSNGNGDLTDDVPIDVSDKDSISKAIKSKDGWGKLEYTFPDVDLKINAEGTEWEYSFCLSVGIYTRERDSYCRVHLTPAVYRQGEITLAGKQHEIVLLDRNANGRFDVPVEFVPGGKGDIPFIAPVGAEILFDQDLLVEKHLADGFPSEHRQFLAKINALGGRFYKIKVRPSGEELTCTPAEVPLGKVTTPHMPCNVWLINEAGFLALDLPKDSTVDIPAGVWHLAQCMVTHAEKKTETTEQEQKNNNLPSHGAAHNFVRDTTTREDARSTSQVIRSIYATGGIASKPITVIAGQTTPLKIGPPYTPTVTVETSDKVAMLGLEFRGGSQEKVEFLSGPRPPNPTFTITDPRGKVVEQGSFEYG
jgi:hypothetical protein